MRTRARVDANQAEIVAALRGVGASCQSLAQIGKGCPDVLCSYKGVHYLLEIKEGKEGLTPLEEEWHLRWKGPVSVVRSVSEALELIGAGEGLA